MNEDKKCQEEGKEVKQNIISKIKLAGPLIFLISFQRV